MIRPRTALLLLPTVLLTTPRVAAAETCSPSRVMVILDKSSSMQTGTIGTATKWSIAVEGLGQVLAAYDTKAEFGLMTFPRPNQCSPGALEVAPAMGNRSAILAALSTPPPETGNWTPMAQTLEAAAGEPSLATGAKRHVILVTDGWQWCSPYDPATRFDGVAAVTNLEAAGITTWIVGFGSEVDAAALNEMALASGTERANCNAASDDPAAPDNCYFQVNNSAELVAALSTIVGTIATGEMCDGVDNNCDGVVDENLTRDCSNTCGAGVETCSNGSWAACGAPAATLEVCGDGEDNDCDGVIDNGCEPDTGDSGLHAGCSCEAGGPLDASAFAPFAVLALLVLRRRRSRKTAHRE